MGEFKMPSLGADMVAGTLIEWKVSPGDEVSRGDVVATVETHKGAIDVEVFESGVVEALVVEEGQEVPVGTTLAIIRGEGEPAGREPGAPPSPEASAPEREAAEGAEEPVGGPAERRRVAPRARKVAEELGVDPSSVEGTGPDGAVTAEDVQRAAGGAEAAPRDPMEGMRQAIAAAMSRSKREIPHYYLSHEIGVGAAVEWLEARNEGRSVDERMLPALLLVKATGLAVRESPGFNGFWRDGGYEPSDAVHVGVAISLRGGGLVAPALHDVPDKPLDTLMEEMWDLIRRARRGKLKGSEMTDATVTVSSMGDQGCDAVQGVIYPPQVALVGFGRIAERPRVVDGEVVPCPAVVASLAADHRASDGHQGGRLLTTIARLLQEPDGLEVSR
ncbi:MAG: dihydrolipoamide acetyltransferase family protein [Myxococcota bacterium]